ncbi:MAG: TetR/AcrR family transcriptional regulator [Pseudorhodoplanes sp.]|uniref:TetR/AcrR family transcriptional regulator n=1 Tax=Pseudorhodoplanes sp. TaxID=1934341 RepID=UPI003D0D4656
MVGVRQFNEELIVERAMLAFWRIGFGATSIDDLEKATKLKRGSLYNAFGDKEGLFVAALKRYQETVGRDRIKCLSNDDPYLAISGFLNVLVDQMSDPKRPRGCLYTNTSLECPSVPDAVERIVAESTSAIESALHAVLERAKRQRMLDSKADTRALARFYLSVAKGMGVVHKVFGDTAMLREAARFAMDAWPAPRKAAPSRRA